MAKKISVRLVALSASAVATIYLAGLSSTQSAAQSVASAAASPSPVVSTAEGSTSTPSVAIGASAATTATTTPTAASTAATTATATATSTAASSTSAYTDGTYSGTGTSKFGNVTVSVTISGGTITDVQITKVTTTFPASSIASLPAQVIQAQSANVNTVSGATYGTQAFKQAVQQALTQAQQATAA